LPRDPANRSLLAAFLVLWAVSCIRVPYPEYFVMQHVPTVLAVIALIAAERAGLFDRAGFALVVAFLVLHLLGARYLYSFVPYDDWSQSILGFRISDRLGFERNHYDRIVHFMFGLLLVYPLAHYFRRRHVVTFRWATGLAVTSIIAAGAVYEIAEWLTAITLAPDWAEAYNGQQGDIWDPQRDMALAAAGALLAACFLLFRRRSSSQGETEK
jgi:putative membrane protein